jgi:hypothetical protein
MRIARKVYMSIFTTMFILITCVATTFAWVGMFTTSTLGSFDLNLKVVDIDADYFLTISNTGNIGSFGEALESSSVKREILKNMGHSTVDLVDDEGVDSYFNLFAIMEPVTTDKDLTNFYSLTNLKQKKPFLISDNRFFKFDLYLSIDTTEGISSLTTEELNALEINANVFFDNITDALSGTISSGSLVNSEIISTIPSNSDYDVLKSINPYKLSVNTMNATRVAFQTFDPIPIDSSYTGLETPNNTIIYQGGKQLPNVNNNVYDLGGILPEEYNLALKEINTIYNINMDLDTLYVDSNNDGQISNDEKNGYTGAKERYEQSTDLEMLETNNKIWQSPTTISGTNYLGVQNGVQTKMKITVYFWYEGFDADCLRLIDFRPTSLNIVLATDKNDNQ